MNNTTVRAVAYSKVLTQYDHYYKWLQQANTRMHANLCFFHSLGMLRDSTSIPKNGSSNAFHTNHFSYIAIMRLINWPYLYCQHFKRFSLSFPCNVNLLTIRFCLQEEDTKSSYVKQTDSQSQSRKQLLLKLWLDDGTSSFLRLMF